MLFLIIAVLACLLAGLWIYARWNHGVLEEMGIPVVEYTHPLLKHARIIYECVGGLQEVEWRKKYGPVFGVYEGRQPQIFIGTPELVRLVCVKDAQYFDSKRELEFGDPVLNEMPDFQRYEKWKLLRTNSTPAFTSAKMKMMNLPMREAVQDYVQDIKKKIEEGKGVYKKLAVDESVHALLTDLIARSFFSVKLGGGSRLEDNEFARSVKDMMTPAVDAVNPQLMYWSHVFPIIKKMLPPTMFRAEPVKQFTAIFRQMMDERRKSGQRTNDVIDMCIDWWDKLDTPEYKQLKITELTLIMQALIFWFAAQDQISTMVAGVIYHMTKDPELERRIYEEVDRVFAKHNGKIEHDQLKELVLMNSCINECLRLYAFFHRTERVCTKDWENEEYNLKIKKGMVIQIPIWALNRNPEYNENPDTFDPDRFMPENKDKLNTYSSTAFGFGARGCTGKQFATESMPLVLAYMLKDLRFTGRGDSEIKFLPGGPFFTPHAPIYFDAVLRSNK